MPKPDFPCFTLISSEDWLQIDIPSLRDSVETATQHDAIANALFEASDSWIVGRLGDIEHPGLQIDFGVPPSRSLVRGNHLHFYAVAIADRIKEITGKQLISARFSKSHSQSTRLSVGEAVATSRPPGGVSETVVTRRSYATSAYVHEVRDATQSIRNSTAPNKPIRVVASYLTGLPRTWSRLWEPTIAGVFMDDTHRPTDGTAQLVELGFDHRSIGEELGHRVRMNIRAYTAAP